MFNINSEKILLSSGNTLDLSVCGVNSLIRLQIVYQDGSETNKGVTPGYHGGANVSFTHFLKNHLKMVDNNCKYFHGGTDMSFTLF